MNKEQIHYEYELETYSQRAEDIKSQIQIRLEDLGDAIQDFALSSAQDKHFLIINNLTQDLINLYEDLFFCEKEIDKYKKLKNK